MLVLEERELVSVEVKGKMERERKREGGLRKTGGECVWQKNVCMWILQTCVCIHICAHGRVRDKEKNWKKREKGKARLLHAGWDDAKSAGWYKSVTTGPSRQSPLQETQIKADLSSQDLFRVVPTSSLGPVAILFLTVFRSVRRVTKLQNWVMVKYDREAPAFLRSSTFRHCEAGVLLVRTLRCKQIHFNHINVYKFSLKLRRPPWFGLRIMPMVKYPKWVML